MSVFAILLLVIVGLVVLLVMLCVGLTAYDYVQHQRTRARYLRRNPDTYNADEDWP